MRKLTALVGLAILAVLVVIGYLVGASELANIELQDDLQDLASQLGTRIGLAAYGSDDELRAAVIRKAERRGIELEPQQITIEHMGSGYTATVYLAADYTVPIEFPGIAFRLHFTPASGRRLLGWRG